MQVTGHVNLGSTSHPCGWVYFGDEHRVCYGLDAGIGAHESAHWKPTNMKHVVAAREYLNAIFPGVQF